jgi:hypothetical protein
MGFFPGKPSSPAPRPAVWPAKWSIWKHLETRWTSLVVDVPNAMVASVHFADGPVAASSNTTAAGSSSSATARMKPRMVASSVAPMSVAR